MSNLMLPAATSAGAQYVVQKASSIRSVMAGGVREEQLLAACIIEANKLPECTKASLATCALNCAILGLIPGEALGHAYFIPFTLGRNTDRERTVSQLIIGYRGLIDLAYNTGFLSMVHPEVVCHGEEFRHWVDINGPQVAHEIPRTRKPTRENIIAAYCVYKTRYGASDVVVIEREEINEAMPRYLKRDSPWTTNFPAMCKKTAVRRASKNWQLTMRLAQAVQLDEYAERGEEQPALTSENMEPTDATEPSLVSLADLPEECDE